MQRLDKCPWQASTPDKYHPILFIQNIHTHTMYSILTAKKHCLTSQKRYGKLKSKNTIHKYHKIHYVTYVLPIFYCSDSMTSWSYSQQKYHRKWTNSQSCRVPFFYQQFTKLFIKTYTILLKWLNNFKFHYHTYFFRANNISLKSSTKLKDHLFRDLVL